MRGAPRRQVHNSGRFFFLLPSMLALLALALFPVAAHATTPGESVYEVEVPSVTSETPTGHSGTSETHHKASNNNQGESGRATGSNVKQTGGKGPGSESEGQGSEEGSSQTGGANPSTGKGGGGGPQGGIGEKQEVAPAPTTGHNASHSSGGSSPIVPILIAIIVLAAISIGVVLYRQRKSDQDGPGGRVSSSNAS